MKRARDESAADPAVISQAEAIAKAVAKARLQAAVELAAAVAAATAAATAAASSAAAAEVRRKAEAVEAEYTCSICVQLLDEPATMPCAHSFCRDCIAGWMSQEAAQGRLAQCPFMCSMPLPTGLLVRNVSVEAAIVANDGETGRLLHR